MFRDGWVFQGVVELNRYVANLFVLETADQFGLGQHVIF
jgi:hypothetical protein